MSITIRHDDEISEVMINGPGPVWVERRGEVCSTDVVVEADELARLVERILAPIGRRLDPLRPWVDGRLPDGSRVNVVGPPIAPDGPCVTIRRFVVRRPTLDEFAAPAVAELLRSRLRDGATMLVSGGTGAGKTTLLNALAGELPAFDVKDGAAFGEGFKFVVDGNSFAPCGTAIVIVGGKAGQVGVKGFVADPPIKPDQLGLIVVDQLTGLIYWLPVCRQVS